MWSNNRLDGRERIVAALCASQYSEILVCDVQRIILFTLQNNSIGSFWPGLQIQILHFHICVCLLSQVSPLLVLPWAYILLSHALKFLSQHFHTFCARRQFAVLPLTLSRQLVSSLPSLLYFTPKSNLSPSKSVSIPRARTPAMISRSWLNFRVPNFKKRNQILKIILRGRCHKS